MAIPFVSGQPAGQRVHSSRSPSPPNSRTAWAAYPAKTSRQQRVASSRGGGIGDRPHTTPGRTETFTNFPPVRGPSTGTEDVVPSNTLRSMKSGRTNNSRHQTGFSSEASQRPATSSGVVRGLRSAPSNDDKAVLPSFMTATLNQQDSDEDKPPVLAHGGFRRRAALEELGRINTSLQSVHDVAAVQKISSAADRVAVKLDFLRAQDDLQMSFMTPVEKEFMTIDTRSGTPLVDIGKVRARRQGSSPQASTIPELSFDGPSVSTFSTLTLSAPRSSRQAVKTPQLMTPEMKLWSLRERSQCHSARIVEAIASAKRQDFERTLAKMEALEHRQARQGLALRARSWHLWLATAAAMVAMRRVVELYRIGLAAAEMTAPVRSLELPLQLSSNEILAPRYVDKIGRLVWRARLDFAEERKKSSVWWDWAHTLRVVTFALRLFRPIRKHRRMDLVKRMLDQTASAFAMRVVVKRYMKKVTLWQRVFRTSFHIHYLIRSKILEPMVWASETHILGTAVGLTQEQLFFEIQSYLHREDVGGWKEQAQRLLTNRNRLWRGLPLVEERKGYRRSSCSFATDRPPSVASVATTVATVDAGQHPQRSVSVSFGPVSTSPAVVGLVGTPRERVSEATAPSAPVTPKSSLAGARPRNTLKERKTVVLAGGTRNFAGSAGQDGGAHVAAAAASASASSSFRAKPKRRATFANSSQPASFDPSKKLARYTSMKPPVLEADEWLSGDPELEPLSTSGEGPIASINKYRMSVEDRTDLARSIHREAIDLWYRHYKSFRGSAERSAENWKKWLETMKKMEVWQRHDEILRPDPPESVHYPSELLRDAAFAVQSQVLTYFRQRQREGDLPGLQLPAVVGNQQLQHLQPPTQLSESEVGALSSRPPSQRGIRASLSSYSVATTEAPNANQDFWSSGFDL